MRRLPSCPKGDELPPGVIKLVKAYVAMEAQALSGRQDGRPPRQQGRDRAHSSEEDMPYLPDGTPVEIILNPARVPSRMNVGASARDAPGVGRHERAKRSAS